MKFLNVYCEVRQADVYINLEKIIVLQKISEALCSIVIEGTPDQPIQVAMPAEELIRKINGDDRAGIGFRSW